MIDLASDPGINLLEAAPAPRRDWALFLDLDGTLLDIAPTPDAVVVPPDLVGDLAAASKTLDGALAIVSGRGLETIDALLKPLHLPTGSEHGAVIRLPDGRYDEINLKIPPDWTAVLHDLASRCPGVLIETKRHSIVAHFRKAPDQEAQVRRLVSALVARDPSNFELLDAKMAFEIRSRKVHKGHVVDALMKIAPFCGRVPVFVGDDATDVDGFRAASALGGLALDVATSFAGCPVNVRDWLKRLAEL